VSLRVERLTGDALKQYLPELAKLRIRVFRDFPYLYEGSQEYEQKYLARYSTARTGTIIVVFAGENVVGASTGLALAEEERYITEPLQKAGIDIDRIFYFGESILLPEYRGQGIGVRFFVEREAAALAYGFSTTCFCAVERPQEHPLRPKDYVSLHDFWRKRGYTRCPEWVANFSWRDIGDVEETIKPMVFWRKELKA
jgi:GNAT superfamily N-acetyltransferase